MRKELNLLKIIARKMALGEYSNTIENTDETIKQAGGLENLSNIQSDPHIAAVIQSRKAGVLSLNWEITSEESPAYEFVKSFISDMNIPKIINEILDAPLFGYKPLEIIWQYQSPGILVPVDLQGKPPWWFDFDSSNRIIFNSQEGEAIPCPENKIIVAQHNAEYDNPYGKAVLSNCYWSYQFKTGAFKFWVVFAEKYGMPFLLAKVDDNTTQDTIDHLIDNMDGLRQDGVMVTFKEYDMEALKLNDTASTQIYRELAHFCNAEISKAVLSQTLTTEQGDTGSYAMSKTHLQVREDVIWADARIVEGVFNKLIELAIITNYPAFVANVPKFNLYADEDIDSALVERDVKLAATGQVLFTKQYMMETYGYGQNDIEIVKPQIAPAFAESHNHSPAIDDNVTGDILVKPIDKLYKEIYSHIIKSGSIDDAMKRIEGMLPTLNTEELEKVMYEIAYMGNAAGWMSTQEVEQ